MIIGYIVYYYSYETKYCDILTIPDREKAIERVMEEHGIERSSIVRIIPIHKDCHYVTSID